MNWYSLRVMSGKEEKIKNNIFRELEYEKDIAENVPRSEHSLGVYLGFPIV